MIATMVSNPFTTFEMQCTTPSLKSTCVEKIEEVSHHKNCEEQCQFVSSYVSFFAQLKCQQICELMNVSAGRLNSPSSITKKKPPTPTMFAIIVVVKNECVTVCEVYPASRSLKEEVKPMPLQQSIHNQIYP